MNYLIGVGNYAMADDGIGLRIVEAVAERGLDTDFEAVEIKNDSLRLLSYFEPDTERMLLVDCVCMGAEPGQWRVFSPAEVTSLKEVGHTSTHESDLLKTLELAGQLDYPVPDIRILGIEPERIEPEMALSQTIAARFEEVLEVAVRTLREGW